MATVEEATSKKVKESESKAEIEGSEGIDEVNNEEASTSSEEDNDLETEQEQLSSEEKNSKDKEEDENEEYKKKYYYVAAEMENLRKRTAREKENFIKYGNEKILSSLLEVMDNFDRTLDAFQGNDDSKVKVLLDGIVMVKEQFAEVLKK